MGNNKMGYGTSSLSSQLRQNMVQSQLQAGGVLDPQILEAFREVPRELFVPSINPSIAYSDQHLSLNGNVALLSPRSTALMLACLQPTLLDHAMVLGCSTGYTVAVLSRLVASAVMVISDQADGATVLSKLQDCTADNVIMSHAPIVEGCHSYAPYDLIVVCGALEGPLPSAWLDQLAEGGKIAYVMQSHQAAESMLYLGYKQNGAVASRAVQCLYVPVLSALPKNKEFLF